MLIGYARVSKADQDTELQLKALRAAGVRKVFSEKRSATSTRRLELERMLDTLREGDQVTVYKLDRLARSVRDLLSIADRIDLAGATLRSLTETIETVSPAGKMAFHMLGAVAEFERALIRERAMAGTAIARANGVQVGRPQALDARKAAQLCKLWETGLHTKAELSRRFGVSLPTIKRTLRRHGLDVLGRLT